MKDQESFEKHISEKAEATKKEFELRQKYEQE